MNINLEGKEISSIEAYSENEIRINSVVYHQNIIVSSQRVITDWSIKAINELTEDTLAPFVEQDPEIILIGHAPLNLFAPLATRQALAKKHIALECMSLGAACRTFNVLLSEGRNVILGIIFQEKVL